MRAVSQRATCACEMFHRAVSDGVGPAFVDLPVQHRYTATAPSIPVCRPGRASPDALVPEPKSVQSPMAIASCAQHPA